MIHSRLSCHRCDRKSRAACAQSFALWQQATIEFTCHDHSIIACSRYIYVWCCSSGTSRSWWITHLTQHHRRGCNNIPSFLQRTAPIARSLCEGWTPHDLHILVTAPFCCDRKSRAACAQSFALWQQATTEFTCHDHSIIICSRHIYVWCCSSRTSRSWWITQSTQHHQRGCNISMFRNFLCTSWKPCTHSSVKLPCRIFFTKIDDCTQILIYQSWLLWEFNELTIFQTNYSSNFIKPGTGVLKSTQVMEQFYMEPILLSEWARCFKLIFHIHTQFLII